ncbi:hypothetical protein SAMN04488065_1650 [Haloplanus vescus]|uniref:Uncharacterized protein n=1 Tax=Haloplanus vescus TaxID=555874 RepID=A0A1H3Y5M8_9EURY|nr:hypothetical protein [Haloplanus vescus]SEA06361.1 hypothetical protein SAMN04488065_1650 [Haloplanus vescus]
MRKWVIALGVVAVVAAAAVGLGGLGGGASDSGSGDDIESFPTETTTETAAGTGGDNVTTTQPAPSPAFAFTVDQMEECGRTCRDVTSTLTNDGDADASDVTVYTRIFAGNGTDGDVVWEGQERVGSLNASESHTTTKRVELSLSDAVAVESAGGWVTVQTTVQSEEKTITFTERRQAG